MNNKKDKKLLLDFFSRDLTDEKKKEFLEKAGSDPDFLKEFIKGVELEGAYEELFGTDENDEIESEEEGES